MKPGSTLSKLLPAAKRGLQSSAWGLFLAFVLLYTLTYAGVLRQDDEHILAARVQSLALWGELEEPQVYGNLRQQALIPLGDKATQIEPLQAVLAAPLYRLGLALGGGGAQMMMALNIFVSAACVIVVYASVQALGYSRRPAIWTAVLFGAGTMVWPFSTTFYRDSLAMLLAGCSWWAWLKLERVESNQPKWLLLLSLFLVAGLLAKNTNMALLLALILALGIRWLRRTGSGRRTAAVLLGATGLLGLLLAWIALIPSTGPLARFSASYMWDLTTYFAQSLNISLLPALTGPLISPSKSIFLYSPPLLMGLAGLPAAWRRHRRALAVGLLTSFLLFLGQGLFYREDWAGVFGWGLRYTLPLLPIVLTLLLPPVIERLLAKDSRGRLVLLVMILVGASVQLAGVLINWRLIYAGWVSSGLYPYQPAAAWDWRLNAIPAGWRLLFDPAHWLTAWVRMARIGEVLAWLAPAMVLVLGLLVAILWKKSGSASKRRPSSAPNLIISLLAGLLPILAIITLYQNDPAWGGDRPDLQSAVSWVNAREENQAPVVVDSYGTPLWMVALNTWRSDARWYSLPYEIPLGGEAPVEPLSEVSLSLFQRLLENSGGLWYIISPDAPDYAYHREAEWLAETAGLTEHQQFGLTGETKISGFGEID